VTSCALRQRLAARDGAVTMRWCLAVLAFASWLGGVSRVDAAAFGDTLHEPAGQDGPALLLFVYRAPLSERQAHDVVRVAGELLDAAGVSTTWVDCVASPGACADQPPGIVIVRFTRGASRTRDACGSSVRGSPLGVAGLVSVDVDCASELAVSLQFAAERVAVQTQRIVGAILAHEVGHLLGLHHAPRGLMAGCLGVREHRALAAGRLHFTATERERMHAEAARADAARSEAARARTLAAVR
jgi:hypothetical protein